MDWFCHCPYHRVVPVRVWIGDQKIIDRWTDGSSSASGTFTSPAAGSRQRIRIDYYELSGPASITFYWTPPGGSEQIVPATSLSPRYGLPTTVTVHDGTTGSPSSVVATSYGSDPEYGQAVSTTQDPSGLNLTTAATYEASGSGYRRQLTRTLPAGNQWSYTYYGDTETRDNPCTGPSDPASQAGMLKLMTGPDPAGSATPIINESVYDAAGRVVASRIGTEAWSCVTYDTRGRAMTSSLPSYGGFSARTVTNNYAVGNDPRVVSTSDPAGTITTTADLLGRNVTYQDVWGKTSTTTYVQSGRVSQVVSPTGTQGFTYDDAGRLLTQTLGAATLATVTYNTAGEATSVTYSNGTTGTISRDQTGAVSALEWKQGTTVLASDTVTRSQSGRVVDQQVDGTDPYPTGGNYAYDGTGRLTSARGHGGYQATYTFAASGGCGAATSAGKNSNRTSLTVGSTTYDYCYDQTDRLTSTTDPDIGTITYDSRGNTVGIGGMTLGFDAANRHLTTEDDGLAITYTRDATGRIVTRQQTGGAGGGTVGYRASSTGQNSGGSTTLTIPKPAGTVEGDLLVAQVAARGGTGVSVTAPAGWTLIDTATNGTNINQTLYWKTAGGSEPANYDFTLSNSQKTAGGIIALTGADSTNPIGPVGEATGNSHTITAPTVTAASDGSRLLVMMGMAGATAITPGPGLTQRWLIQTDSGTSANRALATGNDQTVDTGATGTRTINQVATRPWTVHSLIINPATGSPPEIRYGYTAGGDTADLTLDDTGALIESVIGLPGGVTATITGGTTQIWAYPNIHGDLLTLTDGSGDKQGGTHHWTPFGEPLTGDPDTTTAASGHTYGWLGQHQKPTETDLTLPTIQMGARIYLPQLGRFLEVDPIQGGTENDYTYPQDPTNRHDLTGRWGYEMKHEIGGAQGMTAEEVWAVAVRSFGQAFPIHTCGPSLELGEKCPLEGPLSLGNLPVEVTAVNSTGFSFASLEGNFEGSNRTIDFKITVESGTAYLNVTAKGSSPWYLHIPSVRQVNYEIAKGTWRRFAANIGYLAASARGIR